ncbi:MAG TPA: MBL fold metallo-hydrolase [Terriglobia bacterium]|nr:MBL fold metallo-hydrolase [Terriglobia bacterium]
MKRLIVLGSLLALGGISMLAAQQGNQPLTTQKVKDNLYMIVGNGGNTAAFITADGVVVVDTKNPGNGQAILDQIKKVTPKPVTMIINTHTHNDHVGSDEQFPTTVDIVAQENTKANMEKMDNFKGDKAKFLPKKTFKDKMKLGKGKDEIDLYYFGRAHTNGDAWVVFPALRAMHAGDAFAGKSTPIIDVNNGGSAVDYGKTLSNAAATIKNVDTIIGGHTDHPMTFDDLKQYAAFNNDFITWVQGEIKAGKTVDQAAMEFKIPDKYQGYTIGTFFGGIKGNIQTAYNELGKK